jgi:hypothetical protein
LLSLDRVLLDELMGGEGADDTTLTVLMELLARRRGTAPGRQARDADELALIVDRAGDLTWAELEERVGPSDQWFREKPSLGTFSKRAPDRHHHSDRRRCGRALHSRRCVSTLCGGVRDRRTENRAIWRDDVAQTGG